jgi:hypothetical protein
MLMLMLVKKFLKKHGNRPTWESYSTITTSQAVIFGSKANIFEAKDLAAKARFSWNQEGLSFLFEVTDDIHHALSEVTAWQGDSIQMAVHPEGLNTGGGYSEKDREVLMYLDGKKSEMVLTYPNSEKKSIF